MRRRARSQVRKFVGLILGLALLTGCAGSGQAVGETGYQSGDGTSIFIDPALRGEPIELAGTTLEDAPLDIASLRGRVLVINFWASWCAPCRAEATDLAIVAAEYESQEVSFVGLNTRDGQAAAKAFADRFDTGYPSIRDEFGELTLAFGNLGPAATPTTFVLDREGRIAARVLGVVTQAQLTGYLDAVLAE